MSKLSPSPHGEILEQMQIMDNSCGGNCSFSSTGKYSGVGFYILWCHQWWHVLFQLCWLLHSTYSATVSYFVYCSGARSCGFYSSLFSHALAYSGTSTNFHTYTHALLKLQCGGNWCVPPSAPAAGSKVLFPRGSHFRHTRESSS